MALTERLTTEDCLEPPNEVLLNVIRESDKRGLGTSEIVDAVDLGSDAVRDRLHGLEAEGRVEHETIGSTADYSFVWYLADGEREAPINPEIARLVYWCEETKESRRSVLNTAKVIGTAAAAVVILTLTATAQGLPLVGIDPVLLLSGGWAFTVAAAGAAALGGSLIYIGILAERFGEWLVERES
jgi:hypothetical protein